MRIRSFSKAWRLPSELSPAARHPAEFADIADCQPGDGDDRVPVRAAAMPDLSAVRMCESVESGHTAHDASAEVLDRIGARLEAGERALDVGAGTGSA